MQKHPTLSLWQRDEHGGYQAEINEWTLRLTWLAEGATRNRGAFLWEAEHVNGKRHKASETFEEPDLAMADAEAFAEAKKTGAH